MEWLTFESNGYGFVFVAPYVFSACVVLTLSLGGL